MHSNCHFIVKLTILPYRTSQRNLSTTSYPSKGTNLYKKIRAQTKEALVIIYHIKLSTGEDRFTAYVPNFTSKSSIVLRGSDCLSSVFSKEGFNLRALKFASFTGPRKNDLSFTCEKDFSCSESFNYLIRHQLTQSRSYRSAPRLWRLADPYDVFLSRKPDMRRVWYNIKSAGNIFSNAVGDAPLDYYLNYQIITFKKGGDALDVPVTEYCATLPHQAHYKQLLTSLLLTDPHIVISESLCFAIDQVTRKDD
jgi:hypothetical protein